MKKKSLLILSILFAILCMCTISFGTNELKNGIHNVTDSVVDGVENLGQDVRNGVGAVENTIEDGVRNMGDAMDADNNTTATITGNDNYTATRTTATDATNTNTMNSSLWTWIILAVAGIVIVGLVWYYATQNVNEH